MHGAGKMFWSLQSAFDERLVDTHTRIGSATGTRLRARLESAASTAVRTPVVAVIEYNYERDGEIIVPAGSESGWEHQERRSFRLPRLIVVCFGRFCLSPFRHYRVLQSHV
jgi:hypothetical protein